MSRRAQIFEMIAMETNRLGSTRDEKTRASLEAVIKFLKEQVKDLDSQMLEIVRSNLQLKTLDELLQSVPGVGLVLSATLFSSLPELGSDSRGAISSLVGVASLNHDSDHARRCVLWSRSGSHRGVRFIRGGRGNVRLRCTYGEIQDSPDAQIADALRTDFLNIKGYTVIRFRNEQVLHNLPEVLSILRKTFSVIQE